MTRTPARAGDDTIDQMSGWLLPMRPSIVGIGLEGCARRGIAVVEELRAARGLVVLAELTGRATERPQRAHEAAVAFVRPGHRAATAPAVTTQRVQATVVTGARVRICVDRTALGE